MDSTLEPKLTLEHKVDFPELVSVHKLFISKPESSIPQNHILLLDQGIDQNDLVMIFQDWSCKRNNFHGRILYDPIKIEDCKYVNKKEVNKGRFREPPHYLDWVATLGPIRPPPESPP